MLKGAHGSRIDIDVRIQFLIGDSKSPTLEKRGDGSRCKPLAESGKNPACHKNKLGSHIIFPLAADLCWSSLIFAAAQVVSFTIHGSNVETLDNLISYARTNRFVHATRSLFHFIF
jgi:hypothetical protein